MYEYKVPTENMENPRKISSYSWSKYVDDQTHAINARLRRWRWANTKRHWFCSKSQSELSVRSDIARAV